MSWSDTLPEILKEPMEGWFDTAPDPSGEPVTGWWAAIDLDNAITVQFITNAELVSFSGWSLVLAISVNRATTLRAVRMIAAQRGLTVTINMGLGGTFFLANDADFDVDRLMGLGLVNDISASRSISVNRSAEVFMQLNYSLAPGLITVGRASTLAINSAMAFAREFTVNRSAAFGFVSGLAASQTINVNRALGLGFPPTAPLIQQITASGNYTIPRWANFIAMVALGGGGGGQASAAFFVTGVGGQGGNYASGTVERGNHIPYTQTTMAVTIGAGGAGGPGPSISPGFPGGTTTINSGAGNVEGTGGSGGLGAGVRTGFGPGNLSYDGISAVGGGNVSSGNGAVPGGGGAGSGQFSSGANGARGQAWFRAYQ